MSLPARFTRAVEITAPGAPIPAAGVAELVFEPGTPDFDADGTALATGMGLFPIGTVLPPLAEVRDVATSRLYWVHGEADVLVSLLTSTADHVEARLKHVHRLWTTADILRDPVAGDVDDLGDPVDALPAPPPDRTGVPVAITERTEKLPTDTDMRTVHVVVGWTPASVDVRRGDVVRTAGNVRYTVEAVTQPLQTGLREKRLDLIRAA